jgi:hypothetical protein
MSDTPRDFPIPAFEDEDTKRFVHVREIKPIAEATRALVRLETKRAGQLSVLLWLVSGAIAVGVTLGIPFIAWLTLRVEDVAADVRVLADREHHGRPLAGP